MGYPRTVNLLHSYYGYRVPPRQAAKLLTYALEQEKEKELWSAWLTLYPNMQDEETFIPFEEFKKRTLERSAIRASSKSPEEIEDEMDKIIAAYESGVTK